MSAQTQMVNLEGGQGNGNGNRRGDGNDDPEQGLWARALGRRNKAFGGITRNTVTKLWSYFFLFVLAIALVGFIIWGALIVIEKNNRD